LVVSGSCFVDIETRLAKIEADFDGDRVEWVDTDPGFVEVESSIAFCVAAGV